MATSVDKIESELKGVVRVLYLDPDNDNFDDALAALNVSEKIEIIPVNHAAAAFDMLEEDSFDCIITEYELIQTDGLTFLEEIRDRWPTLSVILYTNDDSSAVVRDAFRAGVTDYVSKSRARDDPGVLMDRFLTAVGAAQNARPNRRSKLGSGAERPSETLFENFPGPVIHFEFTDSDTIVRDVNSAFEDSFGYEAASLTGRSVGVLQTSIAKEQTAVAGPSERLAEIDTHVTRESVDGTRSFRFLMIPISSSPDRTEAFGVYLPVGGPDNSEYSPSYIRQYFNRALTETDIGVWSIDPDTGRLFCNTATERLFEANLGQFGSTADDLFSAIHPDDRDRVRSKFGLVQEPGPFETDFRVSSADESRSERWLRARGTVIHEGDNSIRLVGVVIDITDHRQREAELKRAERVLQAAADPIFSLDQDWRFEFVNDVFVAVTGYDRAALLGEHVSMVLAEEDITALEDIITALGESDIERGVHECELKTAYESSRRFELNVARTSDAGFSGIVGIARDVTNRTKQAKQLQRQRDRFATLFESIPEPAICVRFEDGNPVVRDINDAFSDVFGLDTEDAIGESHDTLIVPQDESDAVSDPNWEEVKGETFTAEVQLQASDGLRKFLFRSVPIETEAGPSEQFAVYIDISERTRAKRQLEREHKRLDVLNRVMSHDIRNYLQAIIGYAEALETELDGPPRNHAKRVHQNAADATLLTQNVDYLSDVMFKTDPDLEPISLDETLMREVEKVRSRYEDVVVEIDDESPATDVLADELLESVFRNILRNAVKHNDKDVPEISVDIKKRGEYVDVQIADNGPGIPADQREALFEKGEQGLQSDGTGIGLYLVRTLVNQYDGEIRVEDNEPEGSVFILSLQVPN